MKRSEAVAAITRSMTAIEHHGRAEILQDPSKKVGWDIAIGRMRELRHFIGNLTEKQFADLQNCEPSKPNTRQTSLF